MRRPVQSEMFAVVVIFATALVVLALTPLMMVLDRGTDRHRPMYIDIETMAKLQYLQFKEVGHGTAAVLDPGESVVVDGHPFTPSEGVSMEVTVSDTGYCIRAANAEGRVSQPQCYDGTKDPGGSLSLIDS